MNGTLTLGWAKVEGALSGAKALAFDGCHKIYVLMDDEQVEETRGYGYGTEYGEVKLVDEVSDPLTLLQSWYAQSCGLKLIDAVRTDHVDPNSGFTTLIAQFAEDGD